MAPGERDALLDVLSLHANTHTSDWLECGDVFGEAECSFDDVTLSKYRDLILAGT